MPTVTELFDGRDGPLEAGGQGNEGIQRRYVRRFRVITDDWRHGPMRVRTAPRIPRIGDIYEEADGTRDAGARCYAVEPETSEEPRQWFVTASYSTSEDDIGDIDKETGGAADANDPNNNAAEGPSNDGSGESGGDNPLARPSEIVYEPQQGTKIVTLGYSLDDLNLIAVGQVPLTASSGEPIDPPIEIPDSWAMLTITRNELEFYDTKVEQFTNTINSTAFLGFDVGKVRCAGISARSVTESNLRFWQVTYSFEIRKTHNVKFLDQGYYQLVGGNKERILDFGGGQLAAPWPLNGAGEELTPAEVTAGEFSYREYRVFEYADFTALNLP